MKTIGIIGAGHIGQSVAGQLLKNNISVLISNSRGGYFAKTGSPSLLVKN